VYLTEQRILVKERKRGHNLCRNIKANEISIEYKYVDEQNILIKR
jgi:hypothetical protein